MEKPIGDYDRLSVLVFLLRPNKVGNNGKADRRLWHDIEPPFLNYYRPVSETMEKPIGDYDLQKKLSLNTLVSVVGNNGKADRRLWPPLWIFS